MSEQPDDDSLTEDEWDKMLELEEFDEQLGKLKNKQRNRSQEELNQLRDKLFEAGSQFSPVLRADIVGIDNILKQIDDVITWLIDPTPFTKWGARPEPGILLEGSPGTGKTLCSRYIASCSNALFVNVRDFATEREVISATDIADLFHRCRSYYQTNQRPVVIFWDEFEVFAREREKMGQSMRDVSVVSQLTAELDGVAGKAQGVLFIGCTNYKRLVDKALLRPGRMGVHIKFVAPDKNGKAKLLEHYLGKFKCEKGLDFESASYFFNDDDTAAAVEEAAQKVWMRAIVRTLRSKEDPIIRQELLNAVLLENLLGPPPPFMELREDSEFAVAVHELGHALVANLLNVGIQVITIQPGTDTFGRVMTHNVDKKISNVNDIHNQICIGLGSVVAENIMGLPNSAHAERDIRVATQLAAELVDDLGQYHDGQWPGPMSLKGLQSRSQSVPGAFSQELVTNFDRRIGDIVRQSFFVTEELLSEVGEEIIGQLARTLLKDKTWTGKQFAGLLKMQRTLSNISRSLESIKAATPKIIPFPTREWQPGD